MRCTALISVFRVIHTLDKPFIKENDIDKMISKHLTSIFSTINEDDDSHLRLAKEIGKIAYHLYNFYRPTFVKVKLDIAKFYKTLI